MVLALLLLAAGAIAPSTSVWRIEGAPGAITSLTGIVKSGGRIVADRMVDDADRKRAEQSILSRWQARSGSCGWAANVRPFTRLRRFAKDGRLLWTWDVGREGQALSLPNTGKADCLSPDGGRLLVTINQYRSDSSDASGRAAVARMGDGVIAVDRRPRFVRAKGARTEQAFGDGPATALTGWQRGRPATLLFDVVGDADAAKGPKVVPDSAELSSPH
ncbi:hypothetical protein [Sphingomonas sp. PAMC 26605]|uniref:hypothetical protein n=1 Tax=Sphingomonas sp. PAMC 26605 TaxID=1112214 RepID=UPI00026CB59C|nr:hypothetical protein [Sphingomonas sp. PAMC 26605]